MDSDMPLSSSLQMRLEDATRDTIVQAGQRAESEIIRELPAASWPQDSLELSSVPELQSLIIKEGASQRTLSVAMHFDPNPQTPVGDDSDEARYLSDVGDAYADLSDAVITTVSRYCDVSPKNPRCYSTDRADLRYDHHISTTSFGVFETSVRYPEYVERAYTEGEAAIADNLRLPY